MVVMDDCSDPEDETEVLFVDSDCERWRGEGLIELGGVIVMVG